jgi:sRNA-binding protein
MGFGDEKSRIASRIAYGQSWPNSHCCKSGVSFVGYAGDPCGTAYAVWTGIGAVGTVVLA